MMRPQRHDRHLPGSETRASTPRGQPRAIPDSNINVLLSAPDHHSAPHRGTDGETRLLFSPTTERKETDNNNKNNNKVRETKHAPDTLDSKGRLPVPALPSPLREVMRQHLGLHELINQRGAVPIVKRASLPFPSQQAESLALRPDTGNTVTIRPFGSCSLRALVQALVQEHAQRSSLTNFERAFRCALIETHEETWIVQPERYGS